MSIEVYTFESGRASGEESVTDWSTQDLAEARQYARENKCRIIANTFEWTDSELLESYCEDEDRNGYPVDGPETYMMEGEWFVDADGLLYIVPTPDVVAECEGPDNEIMYEINRSCRDNNGVVPPETADALGLTGVPFSLRRWTPEDGYYHA